MNSRAWLGMHRQHKGNGDILEYHLLREYSSLISTYRGGRSQSEIMKTRDIMETISVLGQESIEDFPPFVLFWARGVPEMELRLPKRACAGAVEHSAGSVRCSLGRNWRQLELPPSTPAQSVPECLFSELRSRLSAQGAHQSASCTIMNALLST